MRTATCMGYGMPRHDVRLSHTYDGAKSQRNDVACFLAFFCPKTAFLSQIIKIICVYQIFVVYLHAEIKCYGRTI